MNSKSVKVGDVLAFRPPKTDIVGNIINWFSWGGGYCHVAIVYDVLKSGSIGICESNCDKKPFGVRIRTLSESEYTYIDIYRAGNPALMSLVVQKCLAKVGSPYDALAFPSTWFRSVVCRVFGWSHYQQTAAKFEDSKGYYCSELIATGFYEIFESEIVGGLHHTCVTPNDLVGKKSRLKRAV